jgi:hypothetical protein
MNTERDPLVTAKIADLNQRLPIRKAAYFHPADMLVRKPFPSLFRKLIPHAYL